MAIVVRRTFQAKVGAGGPVIALLKELGDEVARLDPSIKWRVLSDYMSGRTDRVTYEAEVDDLGRYIAFESSMGDSPDMAAKFQDWFGRLSQQIEYSVAETWQTH